MLLFYNLEVVVVFNNNDEVRLYAISNLCKGDESTLFAYLLAWPPPAVWVDISIDSWIQLNILGSNWECTYQRGRQEANKIYMIQGYYYSKIHGTARVQLLGLLWLSEFGSLYASKMEIVLGVPYRYSNVRILVLCSKCQRPKIVVICTRDSFVLLYALQIWREENLLGCLTLSETHTKNLIACRLYDFGNALLHYLDDVSITIYIRYGTSIIITTLSGSPLLSRRNNGNRS